MPPVSAQSTWAKGNLEQAHLLLQVSDPTPLVRRHQVSLSWGRRIQWRCPVLCSDLQSAHLCLPKRLTVLSDPEDDRKRHRLQELANWPVLLSDRHPSMALRSLICDSKASPSNVMSSWVRVRAPRYLTLLLINARVCPTCPKAAGDPHALYLRIGFKLLQRCCG